MKRRRTLIFALIVIAAALGVMALLAPREQVSESSNSGNIWTCSMHPQVRLPNPGKCPICSMPLIPAAGPKKSAGTESSGESMLELSEHARAMAGVETVPVERRQLQREIRAVGKVQYNESALSTVTSRVDGYIERLFIDYTGVEVKKGDHLVEIYSPELLIAQGELLMRPPQPDLIELVRRKLRRWELTDEQIDEVLRTRKPQERVTLTSPVTGTVTEKLVVEKSVVKAGDVLYRLANLESVWVYLEIYEFELASVRYGQTAEITTEAYPGETFTGRVWFINPVLTDESRTVKVLVNIANKDKRLKPGMFVSATIRAGLLANGQLAPAGVEGKWTCEMHPQVLETKAGACPICEMPLNQIPEAGATPKPEEELVLAVPVTAVLDTGIRKVAYIERTVGEYEPVELKLGARAGEFYPVLAGLSEGDRVAVRGNFLLDSQSQIQGLPSLFYEHGQAPAAGHQHGAPASPKAPAGLPEAKSKPAEHKH
ncbi:MAG: efflux RND transporter periplasmic adaptor subunit [Chthoniobacteraceae bacterium]